MIEEMYKFNKNIYFQNLRGIWQRYKREYKKVGYNFEFAKRSKKNKISSWAIEFLNYDCIPIKSRFPILTNLAQMLLASVATSVPSETLFSASGYQLWDRRNIISPENIEMITFIYRNEPSLR